MEATFLDFVARVAAAPSDADHEDLLRRAVREVAASRMDPAAGADRERHYPRMSRDARATCRERQR